MSRVRLQDVVGVGPIRADAIMATISRLNRSSDKHAVAETFNSQIMPTCDEVFVLGQNKDGELLWDASGMRCADLLWAIGKLKHDLLFGKIP